MLMLADITYHVMYMCIQLVDLQSWTAWQLLCHF